MFDAKKVFIISLFACSLLFPTQAKAASISNITVTTPGTIRLYEKYEVKFDVNTTSSYPFVQFDANPPPGVMPGIGITIEANITSPSGKTLKHPTFYMTETTTTGTGSSLFFKETNKKYWVLRFSPQETGTYTVSLHAQDASGTTISPVGTFQATTAVKNGFIQVSKQDGRYFEYSNGKLYWPIGPANGINYTQYLGSGMNLERPWMAGRGAYSTNWARWKSSAEQHGNEGIKTRLTFFNDPAQKAPGSDGLAYELFYPEGHRFWLTGWQDEPFYTAVKPSTTYQIKFVTKSSGITGPRNTSFPYGLVIKFGNGIFNNPTNDQIDDALRTNPKPFNHITSTSGPNGWQTFQTSFTTPSSIGSDIYIYLDNVTAGQAYVYELSIKDSTGAELIRNPTADNHLYVEQRPAAYFDWQVTQGEQNGVFFKYVVHDKNDWIQNHLKQTGEWATTGSGYYQPENTKARWLLRQWYRYLTARWGYSTAIHSWELNNEGPPNASDTVNGRPSAPHWRTAQAFAKYIHDTDVHRHLATTSFWCCWRPDFWLNTLDFGDIDYADLHMYTGNPDAVTSRPFDMALWNYESSMKAFGDETSKNVFKPLVRAETGISVTGSLTPVTELNIANPGIWFHNLIWAGINPGAMSDPGYWYSEHLSKISPQAHSRPFSQFMSSLDINQGGYTDAAASTSNSKLRAWGQKNLNKDKAHLWIQNSDHTWKNVMDGINSSQTGTVAIRMNPNTNYTVNRWHTYTGALIGTQNTLSNSVGDLSIPVTSLTDDLALKISSPTIPTPQPTSIPTGMLLRNLIQAWGTNNVTYDLNTDGKVNAIDFALRVIQLTITP